MKENQLLENQNCRLENDNLFYFLDLQGRLDDLENLSRLHLLFQAAILILFRVWPSATRTAFFPGRGLSGSPPLFTCWTHVRPGRAGLRPWTGRLPVLGHRLPILWTGSAKGEDLGGFPP